MPGSAWFWITLSLYALSGAAYLVFLVGGGTRAVTAARWLLGAAVITHTCEIGSRGVAGLHPVSSVREVVGFVAWLIAGAFFLTQLKFTLHAVGAFVVPSALILLATARLSPSAGSDATDPGAGLGILGRVHIMLVMLGITAFALAAALAIVYVFEDRALKRKKFGLLYKRGIALERLDHFIHRSVQVGFPIFTVAIITGVAWSLNIGARLRPEYGIAVMAWAAFAGLLIARMAAGWRGRRAAYTTIVGFSASLLVLGVYLVRYIAGA